MTLDTELICDKLRDFVKAKLNDEIDLINQEKNDGIILEQISSDAYFFESLNDEAHNFDPFIFYFVDNTTTEVQGPSYAKSINIEFDLLIVDDGDSHISRKLLRYTRVMEKVLAQSFNKVMPSNNAELETLDSIDVKLRNSSKRHKCIGTRINFTVHY